MRRTFLFFGLFAGLLLGGCFEHREAPERLVSAVGLDAALELRDTVQKVDLSGERLDQLPAVLAEMPQLQWLNLRRAAVTNWCCRVCVPADAGYGGEGTQLPEE